MGRTSSRHPVGCDRGRHELDNYGTPGDVEKEHGEGRGTPTNGSDNMAGVQWSRKGQREETGVLRGR